MTLGVDIYDAASALYADYVASGSFAWDQVSTCSYHVLACSSGCAMVIHPQTSQFSDSYSHTQATWGLRVEMYIRDVNNAATVLQRKWDAHYSMVQPVVDGTNVNKSDLSRAAHPRSISAPPDTFVEFFGKAYIPLVLQVSVEEEG